MKVYPVSGLCSHYKKGIGLQVVDTTPFSIGGVFKKITESDSGEAEAPELHGDIELGAYARLGCPYCKKKHVYICPHCGNFICYDGAEMNTLCPKCSKEIQVPASDGVHVTWARKKALAARTILMLFDISGSMRKGKLQYVVDAAKTNFISKMSSEDKIMVGTFGNKEPNDIKVECELTNNKAKVYRILDSLTPSGRTPQPLEAVLNRSDFAPFRNAPGPKTILFFTDGHWDGSLTACKNAANRLKEMGYMDNIQPTDTMMLSELNLSVRAFNCLKRSGFVIVRDLVDLSTEELAHIRNLGRKSTDEIISIMRGLGYTNWPN